MIDTMDRWTEIHTRALDAVRAAIDGLDGETIRWKCPQTGMSIAGDVEHVCGAEVYWMREVQFQPNIPPFDVATATPAQLLEALNAAEGEHARLLRERPEDKDVLFGLGRVCQHALYHLARITHFRLRHDPQWEGPGWPDPGCWEVPVDLITETMLGR